MTTSVWGGPVGLYPDNRGIIENYSNFEKTYFEPSWIQLFWTSASRKTFKQLVEIQEAIWGSTFVSSTQVFF